jgi:MFS family permease
MAWKGVFPMTTEATGESQNVESLPVGGRMNARQLFSISSYWFATNLLWAAFIVIVLPSEVKRLDPLHWAESLGLVFGICAVPGFLVPLLTGPLSDRCASRWGRRRPYMVVGVAVNLIGIVITWAGGSWLMLFVFAAGYFVMNVGNNIAGAAYNGVIPDLVPDAQRGEASGWMGAMTQAGNIVGLVSAGVLLYLKHLTAAYVVMSASLVVFLLITLVGVREKPLKEAPPPIHWIDFLKSLWIDPRKYPDFAWVWFTRFLVVMGQYTIQEFVQSYLTDVVGVRETMREIVAMAIMVTILALATVTGLIGGNISDRVGRKPVIYVANTVMAITCLALVFSPSLWYIFPVAGLFGLGLGAYYSVDWALGCDVLPNKESHAAKDMAVWHIAMVLPQTIAVPIASILLTRFPHHEVVTEVGRVTHYSLYGYAAIFGLAAFYQLLGVVFLRNVRGAR